MNKHTYLKNSTKIAVMVILTGMLRSTTCRGQKPIDFNDCRTITRIMNDTIVQKVLSERVNQIEKCIFKKTPHSLNFTCKSFDIGGRSYRILDSADVAGDKYTPNEIVEISIVEPRNRVYYLYLIVNVDVLNNRNAEFEITNGDRGFEISLSGIEPLILPPSKK